MSLCAASLPKKPTRLDRGSSAKWTPWLLLQWACRSVVHHLKDFAFDLNWFFLGGVFLGLFGGSIGTFEGIRAKRLRLQVAYGRTGEAQPRHPRIDGLWKPIHPVHHGNAASRLGAIAHLYQSQYQRSWKPDFDTRFERYQSLNVALCVFLSAGNVNFWPAHHPKRVFKKKKGDRLFSPEFNGSSPKLLTRVGGCLPRDKQKIIEPLHNLFFFFFQIRGRCRNVFLRCTCSDRVLFYVCALRYHPRTVERIPKLVQPLR